MAYFDHFPFDSHIAPAFLLDPLPKEHLGKVGELQFLLHLPTPGIWDGKISM